MSNNLLELSIIAACKPNSVSMPDRNDIVNTIAATCRFEKTDPAYVAGLTYDYIYSQILALAKIHAAQPENNPQR